MSNIANFWWGAASGNVAIGSVFSDNFYNSATYSEEVDFNIRSSISEFRFTYSGTYLGVIANPTAYSQSAIWSGWCHVLVYINDVYYDKIQITDSSTIFELTLPAGNNKNIRLIESFTGKPSAEILGCFITDVLVDINKYTAYQSKLYDIKWGVIGDSITVGSMTDMPSKDGYVALMRDSEDIQISCLGYGYGTLQDFASDQTKLDTTVSLFNSVFLDQPATGKKTILISLGTNDFGLNSTPAATFQTWYGNLLDALIDGLVYIPGSGALTIYCLSPLIRTDDTALLDDYRTAIDTECSTRSVCTHIVGKTILDTSDLADAVHPDIGGHVKLSDALTPIII